ncbi:MAG: hypothetical protein JOZ64_09225 [Solirubrobacterales bacterium]|nr:hypothetical protein [Solirubrobacterales bacterium]
MELAGDGVRTELTGCRAARFGLGWRTTNRTEAVASGRRVPASSSSAISR